MTFTTRAEGTDTVVRCESCGKEMSFCNRDLCGGEPCPPDCELHEIPALKAMAENHCEGCCHEAHAGRCFFVATPTSNATANIGGRHHMDLIAPLVGTAVALLCLWVTRKGVRL